MILRYSRPEMLNIWKPETKFRIWFEIEAHVTDALAELGIVPKESAKAIWDKAGHIDFDIERIDQIEDQVKHDVIAFLTYLSEVIGSDARFIHQGMTSSDLLDTSFNLQLTRATDILLSGLDKLLAALKDKANAHKYSLCIGRSHGIHAEPTTFGLKMLSAHAEFMRCRDRLVSARKEISVIAISGAVGTFSHIHPAVETYVGKKMGLDIEPISTQVVPRDRYAAYFTSLGIIASSIERLAVEIRHLQRTEVLEVEEYFTQDQKGSSAMPHKRNPILSENLTGLARMIRSYCIPAMENVALWHERDISHSSVERFIGPDATVTLDFALDRLTNIVLNLVVYPDRMLYNTESLGGLIHSQRVMLALIQTGLDRGIAYRLVQRHAMDVWEDYRANRCSRDNFFQRLSRDPEIQKALPEEVLRTCFDNDYHMTHVNAIFRRVFKD